MVIHLRKIISILNRKEKVRLLLLLFLILITANVEFVGVGSLFPYMKVIMQPTVIHTNTKLNYVYNFFDFSSTFSFILAIGVGILCLILVKAGLNLYCNYKQAEFSSDLYVRISRELLTRYLNMSQLDISEKNSAVLSKHLLFDVNNLVLCARVVLNIITNSFMAIALCVVVFVVNPGIFVYSIMLLAGLLMLAIKITAKSIQKTGKSNELNMRYVYKLADESLKGSRDIKLYKRQPYFIERFDEVQKKLARHKIVFNFVTNVPIVFINTLGVATLLAITLVLYVTHANIVAMLPTLGIIALSIQRLMPCLSLISNSIGSVRQAQYSSEKVCDEIIENRKAFEERDAEASIETKPFLKSIRLEDIVFKYDTATILDGVSIEVKRGEIVGIVGDSGSGKSTLIDVLLGVSNPQSGKICLDDEVVTDKLYSVLDRKIGYVSQFPFILDASLKDNILFGAPFDQVRLSQAISISQLNDVLADLPNGVDQSVGEAANKLSGGQKQRIGIARAMYSDPDILILDESTSALDLTTERKFYDSLSTWMNEQKAIIIISHRETLYDYCNRVYEVKNGKLHDGHDMSKNVSDMVTS